MPIEIILPKLSLTMSEGTIIEWLKKEGDIVKKGEPLIEVESDKAVMSIPAASIAFNAAFSAKSQVVSPSTTRCRFLIPVRSVIQSSVVSTIFSRSALVITFSGKYPPVPVIFE